MVVCEAATGEGPQVWKLGWPCKRNQARAAGLHHWPILQISDANVALGHGKGPDFHRSARSSVDAKLPRG